MRLLKIGLLIVLSTFVLNALGEGITLTIDESASGNPGTYYSLVGIETSDRSTMCDASNKGTKICNYDDNNLRKVCGPGSRQCYMNLLWNNLIAAYQIVYDFDKNEIIYFQAQPVNVGVPNLKVTQSGNSINVTSNSFIKEK